MTKKLPLRVAVFGTGERVEHYYAPILKALRPELDWVGVWGRNPERVKTLADRLDVRGFLDMDKMVSETDPDILLLCIHNHYNGPLGVRLAEYERALFLETPIANQIEHADRIIQLSREKKFPVEIAEQFHRRPAEELKRALIRNGIFGRVHLATNDFVGHRYHGVSLIRSYIGFDRAVVKVTALGPRFPLNIFLGPGKTPPVQEEWELALLEFDNGALGLFMFTNIAYESNLRWLRSVRFYAEKGLGCNEDLTVVPPGTNRQEFIRVEKKWRDVQGRPVLQSVTAQTRPATVWTNPYADRPLHDEEQTATALCLRSLINAVAEDKPVEYGPEQARRDQAVADAILTSIQKRGEPVVPREKEAVPC